MKRGLIAALAIAAAGQSSFGQDAVPLKPFTTEDDTPVRRATPVEKPAPATPVPAPKTPPATPAPVPKTPPTVPTPPAVPATPIPGAPAAAKPPMAKPFKVTTPGVPEIPDPTGEIRLAPSGTTMSADQIQISIGDSYYAKQMFDMAAPEYEKYLQLYPTAPDRPVALFRLAESYRRNGTVNRAKETYETLLNQFGNGEFIGPAAYRLADLYYQERNYNSALPMFRKASVRLRDAKLANMAKFYTGRTLEGLGQKLDARMVYEDLVASPNENPFIDASRLSLAVLLRDAGRTAEALKHVQALATTSENPELKAEATVRSGLWLLELKQPQKAQEDLAKALEMPNIGRWKDVAQIGLVQLKFNDGKYQEIVDEFGGGAKEVSADSRPQFLILVGNSFRQLGKIPEALKLYDQLIREAPGTMYGKDAAYERLVCLYQMDGEGLLKDIEQFLTSNGDSTNRDQVLLMKAEQLFKKQSYGAAVYEAVSRSRQLAGTYKAKALYKFAWCSLQNGTNDKAIAGFTSLIEGYPTTDSIASALFHRGIARLRSKDIPGAVKDLNQLIAKYPQAKEREPALEQRAILQGQENDNAGMAETYKQLLKEFPGTAAAADANYWIGWVAFENKNYKDAPGPLSAARNADKEKYFERASLRILLAHYYLENWDAAGTEIDLYLTAGGKGQVPEQVLRGVGMHYYDLGDRTDKPDERTEHFLAAAKFLEFMTKRDDAKPEDFLNLGKSQLHLGKFKESAAALGEYLKNVKEPAPRCAGFIASARAMIGLGDFDGAQKAADEALTQQSEGRLNAEARIVTGEIQVGRGNSEAAAKIFESVTVIIDDDEITPRALEKAIEAYEKSSNATEAKRLLNVLQSRYPEYVQRKKNTP
jgi:TolA-binding protein